MSQYPPSYPNPQQQSPYPMDFNYYAPAPDVLAPARRASVGLFVLAGLCMLCGVCVGVVAWIAPIERILEQSGMQIPDTGTNLSPVQLLRIIYTAMGGFGVVLGIIFIVMGILVRRGGKGSAIAALVICLLLCGLGLIDAVATVLIGLKNPPALTGILFVIVPLGLLILTVVWLSQAIRAAPYITAQQQQMMAQMWQYQQQQAAYGGYNQQQVAAPPPYVAPASTSPQETQSPTPPPPNPPDASA